MKKIDSLAEDPRPPGAEKLSGSENAYRVRVGDYRILYEITDQVLLVVVVKVGRRRALAGTSDSPLNQDKIGNSVRFVCIMGSMDCPFIKRCSESTPPCTPPPYKPALLSLTAFRQRPSCKVPGMSIHPVHTHTQNSCGLIGPSEALPHLALRSAEICHFLRKRATSLPLGRIASPRVVPALEALHPERPATGPTASHG